MVTRFGMSENIGVICYDDDDDEVFIGRDLASHRDYSEQVAAKIDEEVKNIIDAAYAKAEEILSEHLDQLKDIAGYLQENETMARNQFESAMQGLPIPAHADSILAAAEEEAPVTIEAPDAEEDPDEEDFEE